MTRLTRASSPDFYELLAVYSSYFICIYSYDEVLSILSLENV